MLCTRGITRAIRPVTSIPLKTLFETLPARTFTSLTPLRPSVFPSISSSYLAVPTNTTSITAATATIAPRISSHPALRALQVRNGPRNTFDPSHRVRKRRVGFLARKRTRGGRAVLKRRQLKGRRSLSH
ncbi:60S ribosomal protein-like protein L34 [Morchella snyderi]|nr:60S ribosomal protein-like protein L34 [Morchella snyderi]